MIKAAAPYFLQIDEEGYALFGEMRVTDEEVGQEILMNLRWDDRGVYVTNSAGQDAIVESFDAPLVAGQVEFEDNQWFIHAPYQTRFPFDLSSLTLDEWDRFHGLTEQKIPFVFSRKAQAAFFEKLDGFEDDSISFQGQTFEISSYLTDNEGIDQSSWWTQVYKDEVHPRWDLGEPSEILKNMLPRLKLPRSRILVLGCGEGHDAAFFAKEGHKVTAVDFSVEAIERARRLYGHLSEIEFIQQDIFKLGVEFEQSFDLVFEHTCYCAIQPSRRSDLVKNWSRYLADKGSLFGVFFAVEKRFGPPFGGTEWEIRERLKKNFQFLFWGRWHQSIARRQGKELFVYATKK